MSMATAELTLIFKAQNLAAGAINDIKTGMGGISDKASTVATDVGTSFEGMGSKLATSFQKLVTKGKTVVGDIAHAFVGLAPLIVGQLIHLGDDIAQNKSVTGDLVALGTTFAGAILEGLSVTFIPSVIKWLGAATLWTPVATVLGLEGRTLGSILQAGLVAGLTIGLVGLLVAGVIAASQDPRIRKAVDNFWQQSLGGALTGGKPSTGPGFNAPSGSFLQNLFGHHAAGGWVGLHGPELSWVGERGPEYVNPAGPGGPGSGFTIQGVSERDIVDMVDRGLYFRLRRAAPTTGRI
jgi:hypothetical protein